MQGGLRLLPALCGRPIIHWPYAHLLMLSHAQVTAAERRWGNHLPAALLIATPASQEAANKLFVTADTAVVSYIRL